jgi:hypothetical protein
MPFSVSFPTVWSQNGLSFNKTGVEFYGFSNRPKTATPVGVPMNTFPFAITGVMNLLPLN